jgi:hypothetical protein
MYTVNADAQRAPDIPLMVFVVELTRRDVYYFEDHFSKTQ